jgi:putative hydrolase of the HAD superfamily
VRAVLFDLDDTLFDHRRSARHALEGLRRRFPEFARASLADVEACYSEVLERIHAHLLRGDISPEQARARRIQELSRVFGRELDLESATETYRAFRSDYDAERHVVKGSHELLRALASRGLRLGIVTNNLVSEQVPKLEHLRLSGYFDAVVISDAVNITKPDPRIFEIALGRLNVDSRDAAMVGDSLSSDVRGAMGVGIRPVWLRRVPEPGIEPPAGVSTIESDFRDRDVAVDRILGRN